MSEALIQVNKLTSDIADIRILDGLNLSVRRGEIMAIVGSSGSGKTTLLRNLLMLLPVTSGSIRIFTTDITQCSRAESQMVRQRWGVMFQHSALFSSLTVIGNVMYPLLETHRVPRSLAVELALLKITMAGLPLDALCKYPSELSGGMQRRAALARAIALDPELLFLDEPTTGLDPRSAGALDDLILHLHEALGLTIVMISHDLDSLSRVTDRVAFLGKGKVLAVDSMAKLVENPHPLVRDYFSGPRSVRRYGK